MIQSTPVNSVPFDISSLFASSSHFSHVKDFGNKDVPRSSYASHHRSLCAFLVELIDTLSYNVYVETSDDVFSWLSQDKRLK